jgi:hypothetical protein
VLGTSTQSAYERTYAFASDPLNIIDAVSGQQISSFLPKDGQPSCSHDQLRGLSNCPTTQAGFDCMTCWNQTPSTLPAKTTIRGFWSGIPGYDGFFTVADSSRTCTDWSSTFGNDGAVGVLLSSEVPIPNWSVHHPCKDGAALLCLEADLGK